MRIWAKTRCFSPLLLILGLSACQSAGNDMPMHSLAEKTGLATPQVEAKDFVKNHIRTDTHYMAVGVTPEGGKLKVRDAKGVTDLQKELEGEQKRAEDRAK